MLCAEGDFDFTEKELESLDANEFADKYIDRAVKLYELRESQIGSATMREIERTMLLRNVDEKWMDHIDAMDDLKDGIGLRAYGQQNPVVLYKELGGQMFDEMSDAICDDTARIMLCVVPKKDGDESSMTRRVAVAHITGEGKAAVKDNFAQAQNAGGDETLTNKPIRKAPKVGRNDPCPCGSGKKYKKCCGANDSEAE